MKRSNDRILTTHVGSLIRPQPLQAFLRAKQAGKPFDAKAYESCLTQSVAAIVRRELDAREEVATRMDSVCIGPISYTGKAELERDIDNFKAALDGVKVEEAFLPVAAPASVIPDRKNEYYASDKECLIAIGAAMRTEYKMIVDAGFILQLDDVRAAVTYDRMVPPASFADYREWVATHMECSTTRSRDCRPIVCVITSAGEAGRGRTPPTCRSRISSTSSSR